jgi:hypothetical protein
MDFGVWVPPVGAVEVVRKSECVPETLPPKIRHPTVRGALQGHRAARCAFIELQASKESIEPPERPTDSDRTQDLAQFMVEFGFCVTQTGVIKLMKLDEDNS